MAEIRRMTIDDYQQVVNLWYQIDGFVIRSIDDSYSGIQRFLSRNPDTCCVAVEHDMVVGAILCGHDGRKGCLYHVCVSPAYRMRGIGKQMVRYSLEQLQKHQISNVSIIAFTKNEVGNIFWKKLGWDMRSDINSYDICINKDNVGIVNHVR